MTIRMLAHILIAVALFLGQAFASMNIDPKLGFYGEGTKTNITSLLTSDVDCTQVDCACSTSDCSDDFMQNCTYAGESVRCVSSVLGTLIDNPLLIAPNISDSISIIYQTSLYHDIFLGITPHPPKPVF